MGYGRRATGALQANALLDGRYRVVRLVGKGGFGAVYEARDERFQGRRVVAIKEMSDAHLSPSERSQAITDFRHEADLLVQLRHPNLPDVSDFFEEGGKAYLVMEYVEGKTLEKEQEDIGGPIDEKVVMDWGLQLCDVLDYLHTRPQPIIFRDMKPSNVMLTQSGQIKLIDFGIARVFKSTAAKDTTSLGSRGYAPLEQYGRGQTDARSDMYALGATLYDLLTNSVPADAPTRRINPQAFETPRQVNPRISPAVESIVLKAMEQEPKDRFQTAAEMYQAIADVVPPQKPVTSGTIARTTTGPRWNTLTASAPQPTASAGAAPPQVPTPPAQQQQQMMPSTPPQRGMSRRAVLTLLGVGAVGVAAAGTGVYFYSRSRGTQPNQTPSGTITVNFTYSTEKSQWMQAAVAAFQKQSVTYNGKLIQVVPNQLGSVDAQAKILNGSIQPTAWSPASFLELNLLNTKWKQKSAGKDIIPYSGDLASRSLVFSPLVFAVWQDRAHVLQKKYGGIDWSSLHSAFILKNGWGDIGGDPNWGVIKFGHTRPDQSNSGLLTITLLAYAYYKKQRGLAVAEINDSGFQNYLADFENAVNLFGLSSGTYLQQVIVQGPAQFDVTSIYENLVLTLQPAVQRQNRPALLPFYPGLNLESDHPFAILQGDWVTPDEREAARTFRDFLLSKPIQQLALTSGFRPTSPDVQITDKVPNNAFLSQPPVIQSMLKANIEPLGQPPGGDVIDTLIKQWVNSYGTKPTTTG